MQDALNNKNRFEAWAKMEVNQPPRIIDDNDSVAMVLKRPRNVGNRYNRTRKSLAPQRDATSYATVAEKQDISRVNAAKT